MWFGLALSFSNWMNGMIELNELGIQWNKLAPAWLVTHLDVPGFSCGKVHILSGANDPSKTDD